MLVEIWSDIVCPFCAIGKKRFEKALQQFEGRDAVQVEWRSFELNPSDEIDFEGNLNEWLAAKKNISLTQAEAMNERVSAMAQAEGLDFHLGKAIPATTFNAHRLTHLARKRGKGLEMTQRLFQAYFIEGENIGDVETLVQLATETDLDRDEVTEMLRGDAEADNVRAEEERALKLGIQGVPFFLLNGKYGISGAQATETFLKALQQVQALEAQEK